MSGTATLVHVCESCDTINYLIYTVIKWFTLCQLCGSVYPMVDVCGSGC